MILGHLGRWGGALPWHQTHLSWSVSFEFGVAVVKETIVYVIKGTRGKSRCSACILLCTLRAHFYSNNADRHRLVFQ